MIATGHAKGGDVTTAAVAMNILAEKELIKKFRHEATWMVEIPSKNEWVNNDVIKLTEIGGDPDVLINNTTYPIAVSGRVDDSVAISLHKFDTTNTKVTDDEINALPYDKIGSVQEQHRLTLEEKTAEYGLHSLAPAEDDDALKTFVIETTGADDGNGRKRLKTADIISLKLKLDNAKVPLKGRVLVLCGEHVADLLLEDLTFANRFQNTTNGVISDNYYGFKTYQTVYNPVYNEDNEKVAYGATPDDTDRNASVAFYAPSTAKAVGSVKRYARMSDQDPENRESKLGFRLYHLVIATKTVGQSAIVSGRVSA
ncbi:MAG: hypothetical protein U0T77_10710 [Chitinophagales bacterium]